MPKISLKKIKTNIKKSIKLARELKRDKRVPKVSKILLIIAIGYFILPVDLIPDFIPIAGQLDDIIIVSLFVFLAIKFTPKEVFSENYEKVFKR